NDAANRMGITVEQLSALRGAAGLAGVGAEQFDASLTKMLKSIQGLDDESKGAQRAFARIGLDIEHLRTLNAAEQFAEIAEAIKTVPTAAERTTVAMEIFGRSGARLLTVLQQGRAGLSEATDDANRFGLALSGIDATMVGQAADAIDRSKMAVDGL